MNFFHLELELLRNDSRNIFGTVNETVDEAESRRRIKECHSRFTDLLKYSRMYNSCVSPVLLIYVFSCTIMLCAISVQIEKVEGVVNSLLIAEYLLYLVFAVIQLFMYCWHSNEVLFASKDLMQGPYESRWWCANVSFQRQVCLLMHMFQTPIVFTVGPFTELTLSTFIDILKGAYSYYTILTQAKN
ncbi:odorant receptor 10-like [Battus philenor]|uniref:odorant receptor 10-like n=1 Tax=Battus philenor TaxID=42288 RepID=UPI0035CFA034